MTNLSVEILKQFSATVINDIIVFIIFFLFCLSIIFHFFDNAKSLSKTVPSLLVSIGIFGTFLGIFIGLIDFDVNNLDDSIPNEDVPKLVEK